MALEPTSSRFFIVAITGGSGAGKTTLAENLAASYGPTCAILRTDSYYQNYENLTPDERAQLDWENIDTLDLDLLNRHLTELALGGTVEVPEFDFTQRLRSTLTTPLTAPEVLIVEGMLTLAIETIAAKADLRVFLDAPERIRYGRRLDRDVTTRGRDPESVRLQWATTVRPGHRRFVESQRAMADLIVDTSRTRLDTLRTVTVHVDRLLRTSRASRRT